MSPTSFGLTLARPHSSCHAYRHHPSQRWEYESSCWRMRGGVQDVRRLGVGCGWFWTFGELGLRHLSERAVRTRPMRRLCSARRRICLYQRETERTSATLSSEPQKSIKPRSHHDKLNSSPEHVQTKRDVHTVRNGVRELP